MIFRNNIIRSISDHLVYLTIVEITEVHFLSCWNKLQSVYNACFG